MDHFAAVHAIKMALRNNGTNIRLSPQVLSAVSEQQSLMAGVGGQIGDFWEGSDIDIITAIIFEDCYLK